MATKFEHPDLMNPEAVFSDESKKKKEKKHNKTDVDRALKTEEAKPKPLLSLRESWEEILNSKRSKKTEPKEGLFEDSDDQLETEDKDSDASYYELDEMITVPLNKTVDEFVSLQASSDTGEKPLNVSPPNKDKSPEERNPQTWTELRTFTEVSEPVNSIPIVETENNNLPPPPPNVPESQTSSPEPEPRPEAVSELQTKTPETKVEDLITTSELVGPQSHGGGINPNESIKAPARSKRSETQPILSVNRFGRLNEFLFTAEFDQWREHRKVRKLKKEQRRQFKRIRRVELLQQETVEELNDERFNNQENLKHLKNELATKQNKYEIPKTSPNYEQRPVTTVLAKETQTIIEEVQLPSDHRLEHSVWHAIEVDKVTGRAVEQPTAISYGSEFANEKKRETQYKDDEVSAASGQLAVGSIASVGVGSGGQNVLTAGPAANQNYQKALNSNNYETTIKQTRSIADRAADPVLWIVLVVVIIAIIAAIKG